MDLAKLQICFTRVCELNEILMREMKLLKAKVESDKEKIQDFEGMKKELILCLEKLNAAETVIVRKDELIAQLGADVKRLNKEMERLAQEQSMSLKECQEKCQDSLMAASVEHQDSVQEMKENHLKEIESKDVLLKEQEDEFLEMKAYLERKLVRMEEEVMALKKKLNESGPCTNEACIKQMSLKEQEYDVKLKGMQEALHKLQNDKKRVATVSPMPIAPKKTKTVRFEDKVEEEPYRIPPVAGMFSIPSLFDLGSTAKKTEDNPKSSLKKTRQNAKS